MQFIVIAIDDEAIRRAQFALAVKEAMSQMADFWKDSIPDIVKIWSDLKEYVLSVLDDPGCGGCDPPKKKSKNLLYQGCMSDGIVATGYRWYTSGFT